MGEAAMTPVQIEAPDRSVRAFDDAAAGPRLGVRDPSGRARCPLGAPGEIVVCAPNDEHYRLRPLPEENPGKGKGDAQVELSDRAAAGVEVERAGVGGFISSRAMVRFKLKF